MKAILSILWMPFLLALSACSTGVAGEQVIGMEGSPFWHLSASDATKQAAAEREALEVAKACLVYGFEQGTTEFAQCMQLETNVRQTNETQRRTANRRAWQAWQYHQEAQNRAYECATFGLTTTCQ